MTPDTAEALPLFGLSSQAVRFRSAAAAVYMIDCDRTGVTAVESLERALDADELDGIRRLKQPVQRQRSTVIRGALRWVLGAYLQMPPDRVPLYREPSGRLRLRAATADTNLSIGCASSVERALIVVAHGGDVGIDVERVCNRRFRDELAATVLHERELVVFETLPARSRTAWLTSAWVRKEATLKALGLGLGIDPRDVEVMTPVCRGHGSFRPTGIAQLRGRSYCCGDAITALVSSQSGLRPHWAHLTL